MDTTYPDALPAVLYLVTHERVLAGRPPQILRNPCYLQGDQLWVEAEGTKVPYRIEECWPTAEEAAAKVKQIVMYEVQYAKSKLSDLEKRLRMARRLADELAVSPATGDA